MPCLPREGGLLSERIGDESDVLERSVEAAIDPADRHERTDRAVCKALDLHNVSV